MSQPAPQAEETILPSMPRGWRAQNHALMADGSLAILAADAADRDVRIWTFDGYAQSDEIGVPVFSHCGLFDRFPDGRWLVTVASGDVNNARILGPDGRELRRIRLGDGIEHLKIDDAGRIWIGWFDEGVFGNRDWSYPGRRWPPNGCGVAAFDEFGSVVSEADGGPHNGIVDCYALNVAGETAWACTYTNFPIVSLAVDQRPRWWRSELSGVRAVAVRPPHVVAAGGYSENGNRVVLVRLGDDVAEVVAEWRLPFEPEPWTVSLIDARKDVLSVVVDGRWLRWGVADFLADARRR